jgi:hypothetical protein
VNIDKIVMPIAIVSRGRDYRHWSEKRYSRYVFPNRHNRKKEVTRLAGGAAEFLGVAELAKVQTVPADG